MIRCLVVNDDSEIRHAVSDYLQRFDMQVSPAADGAQMRRLMGSNRSDLIVLDLMLPDDNGLALCQWVQKNHVRTPVILLTAQGDLPSRIVGLEMGADDYLAKPFEPRELVARIHAVLRRAQMGMAPALVPRPHDRARDGVGLAASEPAVTPEPGPPLVRRSFHGGGGFSQRGRA